jgi:hypothetical protein
MIAYEFLPDEYSYALFISYECNLWPSNYMILNSNWYVNVCRMEMIMCQLIFGNHNILNTTMDAKKGGVIFLVSQFTNSLCFVFAY